VVDKGIENIKEVINILNLYRIYYIQVSTYYPIVNSIIKRGHKPLTNSLSKIIKGEKDRKK
jgi:hypothetical protein